MDLTTNASLRLQYNIRSHSLETGAFKIFMLSWGPHVPNASCYILRQRWVQFCIQQSKITTRNCRPSNAWTAVYCLYYRYLPIHVGNGSYENFIAPIAQTWIISRPPCRHQYINSDLPIKIRSSTWTGTSYEIIFFRFQGCDADPLRPKNED